MNNQSSVARFTGDPDPLLLDQVVPSAFSRVFAPLRYSPYAPQVIPASGKYVITRSAAVYPNLRLTNRMLYANWPARIRAHIVSIASVLKRGFAPPSDPTQTYGIIHSPWTAGYYHWLTESLPRALAMRRANPDAVPLLPSERYRSYLESLRAVGQPEVDFFPSDRNAQVTDPLLTDCPANFATTSPRVLQAVRAEILRNLEVEPVTPVRKIYISRAKSRGRLVLNEPDVIRDLIGEGFEVVYAEDLSFRQQVSLLNSTKILVSIHGAGLTNMLFMQTGASVVEILPYRNGLLDYNKTRNSFKHDACYVRLAAAINLTYAFLQCDNDAAWFRGTHMSNLMVDRVALLSLVRSLQ